MTNKEAGTDRNALRQMQEEVCEKDEYWTNEDNSNTMPREDAESAGNYNDFEEEEDDVPVMNLEELLYQGDAKPTIRLVVNGKDMEFLCDTGACRTTCRETIPGAGHSGDRVTVRDASGGLTSVPLSQSVHLRDPEGRTAKLQIIMMKGCPVNLLGRDGLCQLGIALIPGQDGQLQVRRQGMQTNQFVVQGEPDLRYWYSLDLVSTGPGGLSKDLLRKAEEQNPTKGEQMPENGLHITMWYKTTPGGEEEYLKNLQRLRPIRVTLTAIYSDGKGNSAATATLPTAVKALFRGWRPPHVSLTRKPNTPWKQLGHLVERGLRATDWKPEGTLERSDSTGLTRSRLSWSVLTDPAVHLQDQAEA